MPVISISTEWVNPWTAGSVLIAASVSNFAGTLFPTPPDAVTYPASAWQVEVRPPSVTFYIRVPAGSPAYHAHIAVGGPYGNLGSVTAQLTGGGTTPVVVMLSQISGYIANAQITILNEVEALADGVAYLDNITLQTSEFWTELVNCAEST